MTYKMKCPMCEQMMMVTAADETEAMIKMKEEAKKHVAAMHQDAKPMTDEDMEKMIKESWKMEM